METEKCQEGKCQFDEYQVGGKDASGREIEQIVFYENGSYIIYFVKGEYLRVYFADVYGQKIYFEESFLKLLGEIRAVSLKNEAANAFVRRSLATAYYDEVNGYHEVAIGELTNLKNKLGHGSYVKWMITNMICNSFLVLLCVLGAIACPKEYYGEILYCITSSCIGSFLIHSKHESEMKMIHFFPVIDAVISFCASGVSGFIVYCILQTNLFLGSFTESLYSMMIICFIAGYNEDIPLRLLKSVSNTVSSSKGIDKNK